MKEISRNLLKDARNPYVYVSEEIRRNINPVYVDNKARRVLILFCHYQNSENPVFSYVVGISTRSSRLAAMLSYERWAESQINGGQSGANHHGKKWCSY